MNPFTAAIWQTTSLPYDKEANLARALRAHWRLSSMFCPAKPVKT